jgi:hypothetical protein
MRAILALAVWGFLSLGGANAGTCINRQDGTDTVQSCDNGSYTVTDRHGRRGGFMARQMRGSSAIRGSASGRCIGGGMIEPEVVSQFEICFSDPRLTP